MPVWLIPLIAAGVSAIGGVVGSILSNNPQKKRLALMEAASRQYDIPLPELQQMVGEYIDKSGMEGLSPDAASRQAQRDALKGMMEEGQSGGRSLQSRMEMEAGRQQAGQYEKSQRDAIMQQARMRGTVGSGMELAAQLQAQQSGADRNAMTGLQAGANARQRALQAMQQAGQLGGQIENNDWQQQAQKAQAHDAVAEWNARMKMDTQRYNLGLNQQQFDNQMARAQGRSNALTGNANAYAQSADRQREMWGGIGQGAAAGLNAYAQNQQSQQNHDDMMKLLASQQGQN